MRHCAGFRDFVGPLRVREHRLDLGRKGIIHRIKPAPHRVEDEGVGQHHLARRLGRRRQSVFPQRVLDDEDVHVRQEREIVRHRHRMIDRQVARQAAPRYLAAVPCRRSFAGGSPLRCPFSASALTRVEDGRCALIGWRPATQGRSSSALARCNLFARDGIRSRPAAGSPRSGGD